MAASRVNDITSKTTASNVRELAAVIERAAILGGGHGLEVAQALGASPAQQPQSLSSNLPIDSVVKDKHPGKEDGWLTLDAAMIRHIESTLRRTQGRIEGKGGTAELLAINPHTLRARMRKLRIDWKRFRT